MRRIGLTYDVRFGGSIETFADAVDVVEIKNLEPPLLAQRFDSIRMFPATSLHVQYLATSEAPVTLNLINEGVITLLSDEDSPLYQSYDMLRPELVSFHLGFSSVELCTEGIDFHNAAMSPILSEEDVYDRLKRAIGTIQATLARRGYSGRILLENLDYHPTGAYEHVCEPDFIRQLAEQTGCGVLLDTGHIIITAETLGFDAIDFVDRVGTNLVEEVHVTAPLFQDGKWLDVNQPFFGSDTAVRLIHQLLANGRTDLLLNIECQQQIAEQIAALREMLK